MSQQAAKLMKVEDVAERLNCSISTVYDAVAAGELGAYSVGRRKGYRFSEEQLQAFLEKRKVGGDPSPRIPLRDIKPSSERG